MRQFVLSILICLMSINFAAQNTWIQRDSVKGPPKSASIGFSISGTGFVGLGFDQFEYKRSLFSYDAIFDNWTKKNSLGGATGQGLERSSAVAFVVGSNAYVGTGQGANPYLRDFWKYDNTTDTWTQVADFGGTSRREAAAFGIGSFGYVGTGIDSTGTLKRDFWKYDPTLNSWITIANFGGTARKQAVSFTMGGQGYVGTGDDGSFTNDFWQYEPTSDTWTQKANFAGTPRYGATGFGVFPNAYIGTGYDNTLNYTNDFWEYNYFNETWVQKANFPGTARANATSFVIENRGFLGTGYDGQTLDDFYEYVPVLGINERLKTTAKVYPNPAINEVNIYLNEVFTANEIVLYSLSGKIVLNQKINSTSNRVTAELTNISSGLYLYSVKNNGETVVQGKFIVKK